MVCEGIALMGLKWEFCDRVGIEEAYGVELTSLKKSCVPCNATYLEFPVLCRFSELSLLLDPSRTPKSDKASILSDAARVLVEKNELRDEKMKLKGDKEKLEQQVKAISMAPSGFMRHPLAYHHPATFSPHVQAPSNKAGHFPAYPGMAMWQWLPPAVMDTTQDSKLWPPNA
ncbi:hypothetical protein B296_00021462 [Ensete ventricosum]|uniref:BHLH domain-containing protein n=1 Tax=Ensete ventricosum TaxID=4639 RepID=A0A427APY3_ENSVE|nr:hypothetical protein B296_00021462 [Ensete ventricosum]